MQEFDIVIIGGGSAAFAAALKATEVGAKVAICEEWIIGGTCLNRGCIPSKHLLKVAETYYLPRHNPFKGIEILQGQLHMPTIIEEKDKLLEELREEKYINILKENKDISYFQGTASFVSDKEIQIGNEILRAERFIIATGARPQIVSFPGINEVDYLTSTSALDLKELPESMIIIGGRFVAVEMAQIFSRFGVHVTILQRSNRIIPAEEEEISTRLRTYLEEEGIEILTGVKIERISRNGIHKVIHAEIEGAKREFKADKLLMATGITPNTEKLNLQKAGVRTDEKGFVITDEYMRTSNPSIFAAGDVVGTIPLVTVAAMEGGLAGENALSSRMRKVDYTAVPHAIFTDPNVASVGLTEREALQKGLRVKTKTLHLSDVPKARAIKDTRGLIKIVAEAETEKIIGIHILAPEAAEIIHQGVLIIKAGMTVRDVIDKVDVYPTLSEMVKLCAQSFYKDVRKLSCCAE